MIDDDMVMATGERRVGRKGSEGVRGGSRSDRIRRAGARLYKKMAPDLGWIDGVVLPHRHRVTHAATGRDGTGGEDLS